MQRDWVLALVLCAWLAAGWSSWTDLMLSWNPKANSSYYRFDLPGPDRLQVELIKHFGGNHNRVWEIQISRRAHQNIASPFRLDDFLNLDPGVQKEAKNCLTRRAFVGAKDRSRDPQPGIWIRSEGDSWSFLSYQGIHDASEGPITIVPRSRFKRGDSVPFGEGYFTWRPGMADWVAL